VLVALVYVVGCAGEESPAEVTATDSATTVRDIRVLLGSAQSDYRLGLIGPFEMRNRAGAVLTRGEEIPWSVVSGGRGVVLGSQPLGDTWIELVPEKPGAVFAVSKQTDEGWSDPRYYAGTIRLLAESDGEVLIVNVVDLETYLAGVLPGELYPNFHVESYRAQAIAARTYALYEMSTAARAEYDVTNGEASQVYAGVLDTPAYRQAWDAAEYTRGLVCTWSSPSGARVFCTFFSSACGGRTQNAAYCKVKESVPPLAGGVQCDFCQIAKGDAYRWPAKTVAKDDLFARIVARYPKASQLGKLANVTVLERDPGGRPVRIGLTGRSERTFELFAENFRLAVGSRVMRSTDCDIRVDGDNVHFENGKGFGHGLGLCQWGMEGQAREGCNAAEILHYYYPGVNLTRAY
jgi:stage II sporulation protein D